MEIRDLSEGCEESRGQVLIAPVTSRFNRFIDRFADAVRINGYETAALDWKLGSMRRSSFMIVHWPDEFFSWRKLPRALQRLASIALARAFGSRLLWVVHNVEPHGRAGMTPVGRRFLASVDGLIFLSHAGRPLTLARYPDLRRDVRTLLTVHGQYIPVSAATARHPPAPDRPVRLLHFGLLRRYKNVETLVRAFQELPAGIAELTVTGFAADPAYIDELRSIAGADVRIDARDTPIDDVELEHLIDRADLIVLPYRNILNSGSAFHALSRNRPILAPNVGAMPELQAAVGAQWVHLLYGPLSAAALAEAIATLRNASLEAHPDLRSFSWERVAADIGGFLASFGHAKRNDNMTDTPAVSVILPTYNRRHCLPRAVESVLRQTFTDFELLVVDDCSKDDTLAWLATIADPRLRVLRHEVNKGGAAARNTGIAAARAPVIAFQDSDDEWLVTMLDRQIARMAELGPEYGASYCGKIVYGRDDRANFGQRRAAYMPDTRRGVVEGDIYHEILQHGVVSTQTLVVQKAVLDAVGTFDETLRVGLDWELTARIAKATKFAFIDEPLVMTFLMNDSITHRRLDGATTAGRLLDRHAGAFAQRPDLYAQKMFDIGRIYQRNRRWRAAIPYLARAGWHRPQNLRIWAALTGSLLRAPFSRDLT